MSYFFFFNDTATTEIYTLSLHDALPISEYRVNRDQADRRVLRTVRRGRDVALAGGDHQFHRDRGTVVERAEDRKSTRLNSSHANISYAVFCLKKKKLCHETSARLTAPSL